MLWWGNGAASQQLSSCAMLTSDFDFPANIDLSDTLGLPRSHACVAHSMTNAGKHAVHAAIMTRLCGGYWSAVGPGAKQAYPLRTAAPDFGSPHEYHKSTLKFLSAARRHSVCVFL